MYSNFYSAANEPKLVLMYGSVFKYIIRQIELGSSEPEVLELLFEFVDTLSARALPVPNKFNILGTLGITNYYYFSPTAKFVALAIILFCKTQVTPKNKIRLTTAPGNGSKYVLSCCSP